MGLLASTPTDRVRSQSAEEKSAQAARCSSSLAAGRTSYTARRTGQNRPGLRWAGRRAVETQRSFGRDFAAGPAGLVGVVVGLHVHGGAGFVPGADVVAMALVGQRGVVVPLGRCARSGRYRSGCSGLPHKNPCCDVFGCGAQFGASMAGGVGLARPAGGAVIPKPRTAQSPNPPFRAPKVLPYSWLLAALLAVSLLAVAALRDCRSCHSSGRRSASSA